MSGRFDQQCSVTVSNDGDVIVVAVAGDLDRSSSAGMADAVRTAVEAGSDVLIDVCAAQVIDSAALGELIGLHRTAVESDVSLSIAIDDFQRRLFDIAGLSGYLDLVSAGTRE